MKMNRLALWHKAKSEFSYAYDDETLHITLRTARDDLVSVKIIHGDPFSWINNEQGNTAWKHKIFKMHKRYQTQDFDYYFVELKPPYLRTKYAFLLEEDNSAYLFGAKRIINLTNNNMLYGKYDLSEYYNYPYLNNEDLHRTPEWVKDTVWYQIFPDRFYSAIKKSNLKWGELPVNNNELYGGDIKGVIEKLPYLKDLGISGIYFTPIFEAPSAHKYDTTDYFKIDPQFGTNKDFKTLVQSAHKLGIKVMLDGVFNHCGYDHEFFQDVIENGERSKYKDCFFIDKYPVINFPLDSFKKPFNYHGTKLNYRAFAFTPYMPKWNTENPIASKYLLECITFWIKEYDIDGWRLDVSNEISHDFLRMIRKVSRKAKQDTFILGENWDSSYPWLYGDQLDSVMNYDLSDLIWKYAEHKIDLASFKNMTTSYLAITPKNIIQNTFNLVGSHDTVRIKRRLNDNVDRVKIIFLLMFLSAGSPNIYYGDEIGLTGEHDPDNRRCMIWNQDQQDLEFHSFVRSLIKLRKKHSAFAACDYHFIDSNILIFRKEETEDNLLVIINNGEKTKIELPEKLFGIYTNLFTTTKIKLYDKMVLDTYSFLLLKKESLNETNH